MIRRSFFLVLAGVVALTAFGCGNGGSAPASSSAAAGSSSAAAGSKKFIIATEIGVKERLERDFAKSNQKVKFHPFLNKYIEVDEELSGYPKFQVFIQRCPYFYHDNKKFYLEKILVIDKSMWQNPDFKISLSGVATLLFS